MPNQTKPLPEGVTPREVAAESLLRMAQREATGIRSNLLGMALVLLLIHNSVPPLVLALFVLIRLAVLWHNHLVTRRVLNAVAGEALDQGLDHRMVLGVGLSGLSWGLLAWLIPTPQVWGLSDQMMMLLLTIVSALSLIVTAHLGRAMVCFNVGLWGVALMRFSVTDLRSTWPLMVSLMVMSVVLWLFGRQLHAQALAGVIAELRSHHLAQALAEANTQLTQALNQAMAVATRDPLTQALNRRAFLERAQLESATMQREGHTACILMLDLDHFKAVNDRHGHGTGDVVLQHACSCIQSCLREVDVLARWGGEEFLILLPRTELSGALQVAERIRRALETAEHPAWPTGLALSASMGIAPWPPNLKMDLAITQADKALYRAKGMGRNRIDIWP